MERGEGGRLWRPLQPSSLSFFSLFRRFPRFPRASVVPSPQPPNCQPKRDLYMWRRQILYPQLVLKGIKLYCNHCTYFLVAKTHNPSFTLELRLRLIPVSQRSRVQIPFKPCPSCLQIAIIVKQLLNAISLVTTNGKFLCAEFRNYSYNTSNLSAPSHSYLLKCFLLIGYQPSAIADVLITCDQGFFSFLF